MSTELIEKTDQILANARIPERHSDFQIEKFLIGKEPTAQSQLWQITKELRARQDTREALVDQIEETEDVIDELQIKLNIRRGLIVQDEPEELKNIQIRRLQRQKRSAERSLEKLKMKYRYLLEEMRCLVAGYEKITAHVGPMKSFDDEQAQREYWNEKLLEEFNLRVIFQRPLDNEFVRTVMALDDDAPVKRHVSGLIQQIQTQMIADQNRQLAAKQALDQQPQVVVKPKIQG